MRSLPGSGLRDDDVLREHVEALLSANDEPDARFDNLTGDVDCAIDSIPPVDSAAWRTVVPYGVDAVRATESWGSGSVFGQVPMSGSLPEREQSPIDV